MHRLFDGIDAQVMSPDEVILVDSGSTDDTVRIAETRGAEIVHVPPGEFTFGHALNLGCAHAKGDIFVFVSAHTYPCDAYWLQRLIEPFGDPNVGLCYGGQTGGSSTAFSEQQVFEHWFPDLVELDQRDPFCNNANCAVRAEQWEAHPYDEALPGLEDIAWAKELLTRGGRIAYVGNARVHHIHDEHFRQVLNRYRREAMAYVRIFGSGEMSLAKSVELLVRNLRNDLSTARAQRRLLRHAPGILKFRTAQFVGAYRGHHEPSGASADVVRRMYYPRASAEKR